MVRASRVSGAVRVCARHHMSMPYASVSCWWSIIDASAWRKGRRFPCHAIEQTQFVSHD